MASTRCRWLWVLALLLHTTYARHLPVIDGVIAGVAGLVPRSPTVWTPLPVVSLLASLKLGIVIRSPPTDPGTFGTVGTLRYVENSGVCETTPGVYQASGYADIAQNQSIFFWYFASRKGEEGAPLTVWMNGGPGSSSMLGLFQELGPCRVTDDALNYAYNPYSWSNASNMLFIDQPVGVGFSYGTAKVNNSQAAAEDLWTFIQVFLSDARFSRLANSSLGIWTESYGGHYGPTFANYILQQNTAIDTGLVHGIKLNLSTLGIGNGLTNALVQYPHYVTYAMSNPYNVMLANDTVLTNANTSLYTPGGCLDMIEDCYASQTRNGMANASVCAEAQQFCNKFVLTPIVGNYDEYDVRLQQPALYPPDILHLLRDPALLSAIGVPSYVNWTQSSKQVYNNFARAGDWMTNTAPYLENVINAGIRVTLYDGDADYICNYQGFQAVADALNTRYTSAWTAEEFNSWKVGGQAAGVYKNAGPLSFVGVAGAGHEVPAYGTATFAKGQAALALFEQTLQGLPITST
ncbi:serine carboxypeptidase [Dacryopinax primogenitus]|uniref:Carboxypeptidase n=1 Tax=Dacryopinax primogenitus (strain DJM 731) TaxID=1858805 RepID=M5GE44_DACPD|nr:serine carboxypeptidase [Dacryopinax primogenitus]EJU02963.1 serine carboxypeptidase [Dacryopinax primogenitus]